MRNSIGRLVVVFAVAWLVAWYVSVAAASARSAGAQDMVTTRVFRGPGGNVVCGYFSAPGLPPLLECGVANQLAPPPPRPSTRRCGGLDFAGNRLRLSTSGPAFGFCTGDAGVLAELSSAPRLPAGTTWHQGPFSCTVSTAWVDCSNKSGRGFSISRYRWRAH